MQRSSTATLAFTPYGFHRYPSTLLILMTFDILNIVVRYVYQDSPESLLKLCKVSKQFYFISIPWLYRTVTINFSKRGTILLERLSNSSSLARHVRQVVLKYCNCASARQWMLLSASLLKFTRLVNLSWDCFADLPSDVLDRMHNFHPRATLQASVVHMHRIGAIERYV